MRKLFVGIGYNEIEFHNLVSEIVEQMTDDENVSEEDLARFCDWVLSVSSNVYSLSP